MQNTVTRKLVIAALVTGLGIALIYLFQSGIGSSEPVRPDVTIAPEPDFPTDTSSSGTGTAATASSRSTNLYSDQNHSVSSLNTNESLKNAIDESILSGGHTNPDVTLPASAKQSDIKELELVWIEPGTFWMGSPDNERGRRNNEGPQTPVTLTYGYWLAKHETTWAQYNRVLARRSANRAAPNQPVSEISWSQATNFCHVLTTQERAAGRLPDGFVYRLPTEAEWENACRAGTSTRFSFGDGFDRETVDAYMWYERNEQHRPQLVGEKLPNQWGLYDMHGNVAEWCLGIINPSGIHMTNPIGEIGLPFPIHPLSTYVVGRGASSAGTWETGRSAFRHTLKDSHGIVYWGFRVALAPEVRVIAPGNAEWVNHTLRGQE